MVCLGERGNSILDRGSHVWCRACVPHETLNVRFVNLVPMPFLGPAAYAESGFVPCPEEHSALRVYRRWSRDRTSKVVSSFLTRLRSPIIQSNHTWQQCRRFPQGATQRGPPFRSKNAQSSQYLGVSVVFSRENDAGTSCAHSISGLCAADTAIFSTRSILRFSTADTCGLAGVRVRYYGYPLYFTYFRVVYCGYCKNCQYFVRWYCEYCTRSTRILSICFIFRPSVHRLIITSHFFAENIHRWSHEWELEQVAFGEGNWSRVLAVRPEYTASTRSVSGFNTLNTPSTRSF